MPKSRGHLAEGQGHGWAAWVHVATAWGQGLGLPTDMGRQPGGGQGRPPPRKIMIKRHPVEPVGRVVDGIAEIH
eukprot:scaffold8852_cov29-Phaeocystis_antarctica.AAC.3